MRDCRESIVERPSVEEQGVSPIPSSCTTWLTYEQVELHQAVEGQAVPCS